MGMHEPLQSVLAAWVYSDCPLHSVSAKREMAMPFFIVGWRSHYKKKHCSGFSTCVACPWPGATRSNTGIHSVLFVYHCLFDHTAAFWDSQHQVASETAYS